MAPIHAIEPREASAPLPGVEVVTKDQCGCLWLSHDCSVAKGLNLKNATILPNHAKNHATTKILKSRDATFLTQYGGRDWLRQRP